MNINKTFLLIALLLGYPILYFALSSKKNQAQKLLNIQVQELKEEKVILQQKFDSVIRVGKLNQAKIKNQHEKDVKAIQHSTSTADDSTTKAVFEQYFGKARQL